MEDRDIERILAVSRMSNYCRKAIHYGISLAQKYNAQLSVIHVMYNPFTHMNMPMMSLEEEHKKEQEKVKKQLDRIIEREKNKGMVIKEFIKKESPLSQIKAVVKDENIDLLILHSHEDTHWDHFLYGYSNEEIIRKIPCSVLLVRRWNR
ncbi:MAG TPA: universal stress protein [Syntrophales bacterium]|nr:universal stress protein [Syntrophales bacterium]